MIASIADEGKITISSNSSDICIWETAAKFCSSFIIFFHYGRRFYTRTSSAVQDLLMSFQISYYIKEDIQKKSIQPFLTLERKMFSIFYRNR